MIIINYENNPFKGIINSHQQETNIKDEINITWSSNSINNEWNIFVYDKENKHFYTNRNQDEWICIEFKQHEIIPTHYSIKSGTDSDNMKTFVLEGSKDKNTWEILDEQNNISYLYGKRSVHTFPIQKQPKEPIKYLRIRQELQAQFCCIEFFGKLF